MAIEPADRPIRSTTLHQRIEEDLRRRIQSGEFTPGAMMPGRKQLAGEYGVVTGTVQKALSNLITEGYVRTDHRRGTFVSDGPVLQIAEARHSPQNITSTVSRPRLDGSIIGVIAQYLQYPLGPGEDVHEHWTVGVVRALERAVADEPGVIVHPATEWAANGSATSLEDQVSELVAKKARAIVVAFSLSPSEMAHLSKLTGRHGLHLVYAGSETVDESVPSVIYDPVADGYFACKHLIEAGYTDILFASPMDSDYVQGRAAGARLAVAGFDSTPIRLQVEIGAVSPANCTQQDFFRLGVQTGRTLSASLQRRAVIATNDRVALGLMTAASDIGLSAGVDYAIVGFDDLRDSRMAGLTSMRPPIDAIGAEAARLVLELLRCGKSPHQVRLRSDLIPRLSTVPIRSVQVRQATEALPHSG